MVLASVNKLSQIMFNSLRVIAAIIKHESRVVLAGQPSKTRLQMFFVEFCRTYYTPMEGIILLSVGDIYPRIKYYSNQSHHMSYGLNS